MSIFDNNSHTALKKFKFWANKVLPAVYDDSLSYYEVLCKVVDYLNEVIEVVDTFDTDVSDIKAAVAALQTDSEALKNRMDAVERTVSEYDTRFEELSTELTNEIDAKVAELTAQMEAEIARQIAQFTADITAEIDRLNREVNAVLDEVRTVVGSLDVRVEEAIAQMQAQIQAELDVITSQLEAYDEYIDRRFITLQKYIDDTFEELKAEIPEFENVMVVNPYTTKLNNIQKVVYDLAEYNRENAITVGEFERLNLTCAELDNYIVGSVPRGLSVIEYDYKSRILFSKILDRVHSIVNGTLVPKSFNDGVLEKCAKQSGSYTAGEWDGLNKDCDELDSIGVSCYNIDWRSNTFVA